MNLFQYERVVRQYRHRVFGLAFYLLGNREEAEDQTQEVLIRLWKNRHSVDDSRITGWLLRVTRNACIDVIRKRRSFQKNVITSTELTDSVPANTQQPDEAASWSLFRNQLEGALRALSEPYRSILILREIQEMKYDEIAEIMNLPLNTVKVYLHRGRKTLRALLSEVSNDELS